MSYGAPGDKPFVPNFEHGHAIVVRRYEAGNPLALAEAEKDAAEHPQDTYILMPHHGRTNTIRWVQSMPVTKPKEESHEQDSASAIHDQTAREGQPENP